MANTPPRPPIHERLNEELLEDLCRELRHVAVSESSLPKGERVVAHVREVCAVHIELSSRHVDCAPRLVRLSEETGWQIPQLLADCLAYPTQLPFVREPDGIRQYLRCRLCSKAERPPDAQMFWFCEACMRRVLDAVRQRKPIPGIVYFAPTTMSVVARTLIQILCWCARGKNTLTISLEFASVVFTMRLRDDVWPNKSPEPTAVGAGRSAIAVPVASRRWLSCYELSQEISR
jgi:hypothetical protein